MSKSKKMAVRTDKPKQRKLNLSVAVVNRQWLKRSVLLVFVTVVILTLTQASKLWTQLWPVEGILVEGELRWLETEQVASFVREQNIDGMLALDLNELRHKTQTIDWVDQVELRKVWPNQLLFVIKEHEPVARFNQTLLTQKGTLVKAPGKLDMFNHLPQFLVANENRQNIQSVQRIWQDFREIKRKFEIVNLSLEKIEIDELDNWLIHFDSGLTMILGRRQQMQRVERVVNVYAVIENKSQIKVIDLRYQNGLSIAWKEVKELQLKG